MKIRHALLLAAVMMALAGCNQGTGDRVLVAKCLYDSDLEKPHRFDVVVFKYPKGPLENGVPKNYIKRLLGLPGQILAIFFGQLFSCDPGEPSPYEEDLRDPEINHNNLWKERYMHMDDDKSHALFEAGRFDIVRKPPDVMLALRRIVYDNDYQADDLGVEFKRWAPKAKSGWKADNDYREFSHAGGNKTIDWLRYQNLIRPADWPAPARPVMPQLITDFMGYNSFVLYNGGAPSPRTPPPNWVGDLMLECKLTVAKAEGQFYMELSKGINRFRARWDLETGMCTLQKQGPKDQKAGVWEELDKKQTNVKKPGTYQIRFANFDARLTVWVDRSLPFGDGRDYPPPEVRGKGEEKLPSAELVKRRGPTENDLQPASIGSQGASLQVRNIRLWRDTYYTLSADSADASLPDNDWSDPGKWDNLRDLRYKTMFVQPGHYLCLGDNSPASSDSRHWGVVPERLMLGRALLVYFPFSRAGPIR